jgi:hypothetical protein
MSSRTEIDRLAAARPEILGQTECVVNAAEEEHLLEQILHSSPPLGSSQQPVVITGGSGARDRRRARRAPRATVAALAATAVAVGATLVGIGVFSGSARPNGQDITLTAQTVVNRTAAALGRVSNDIIYSHTTAKNSAAAGAPVGTYHDEWRYGDRVREEAFSPSGSLLAAASAKVWFANEPELGSQLFVDYTTRTWYPVPGSAHGRLDNGSFASELSRYMKWELSVGALKVIGSGVINGRPAIKMSDTVYQDKAAESLFMFGPRPCTPAPGSSQCNTHAPRPAALTTWIDRKTYLPIMDAIVTSGGTSLFTTSYRWLMPTAANMAEVRALSIPAGFRKVTSPGN